MAVLPFLAGNVTGVYNTGEDGVFGRDPLMTPKYARNNQVGGRDAEFRDTLARMFLSLSGTSTTAKKAYLRSLPPDDVTQALANVLIGDNTGTSGGTGFIDFFLGQVQEQWSEKVQISELLSDNYVAYFFGQAPPVFTYTGTLLNSFQDDQRLGMAIAYQELLRGTQCARRGSLLRLRYDGVIVSGTVLSMGQVLNAENELAVPFNFQMLVKQYQIALTPRLATTKVQDRFDAGTSLDDVGSNQDVQVLTSMFVPDSNAANSVVGKDQTIVPTDTAGTAQQSLENKAQNPSSASPTADILGTLSSDASTPPASFAPSL